MNGNWAFNWVQVVAHNRVELVTVWGLITLTTLLGLTQLDITPIQSELGLLALSLLLMSVVVAYLMDSIKVAVIQCLMSIAILAMTLGILGWFQVTLSEKAILGLVVVVTLVTSNLVHVLTTLLREMARGAFQFDAVPEALKLNVIPLFLSNVTTVLGFLFAAWFSEGLMDLALVVTVGVLLSYLVILSWLPLLLLTWLLEFRVGNSADRHGFSFIASWMIKHPKQRVVIALFSIFLGIGLIIYSASVLPMFEQITWMVTFFLLLFLLFWKKISLALINVWLSLSALLMTASVLGLFIEPELITALVLMVPLGLIVDDGIHFFSRHGKATKLFYAKPEEAVSYAIKSVGRAIWITSWVLIAGLAVLLFSANLQVQLVSVMTILAIFISTFMVLIFAPALLISSQLIKA